MQKTNALLIFTDLDGSLLNHDDYNYTAAKPLLASLAAGKIPVIPTTSKTYSELSQLRQNLNNAHPFIVENGAAIYIPNGYFDTQPTDTITKGSYWVKEYVKPRAHWQQILASLPIEFKDAYTSFAEAGVQGIIEMTGLDTNAACMASEREYGEPIKWQADDALLKKFISLLESQGVNILKGGRFYHISGACDKGQALSWLQGIYQQQHDLHYNTLSIGDSHNDIAMLEATDYACVVHSNSHATPVLKQNNRVYYCQHTAPEGWVEGVEQVLNKLRGCNNG